MFDYSGLLMNGSSTPAYNYNLSGAANSSGYKLPSAPETTPTSGGIGMDPFTLALAGGSIAASLFSSNQQAREAKRLRESQEREARAQNKLQVDQANNTIRLNNQTANTISSVYGGSGNIGSAKLLDYGY